MRDCLPRLLAVLHEDLVGRLVDLLQLASDFLGGHEEVDAFDFGQFLQLADLPPRADQHVSPGDGLVIDDGEDVLSDEENLRGGDVGDPEDDISRYLLRHSIIQLQ